MHSFHSLQGPRRQRGVALVLALLLAALAVTLVSGMYVPQQLQLRALENQLLQQQARLLLGAALEDCRDVLRRDAMEHGNITTRDGLWQRAAQALPAQLVAGLEAKPALSVRIVDAQSRYNLRNLAAGQVQGYRRLLALRGLDPALAERTAAAFAAEQVRPGLPMAQLEDLLSIPGYTPQAIAALRESVVILPQPTTLNLHTAAPELLAALLGLDRRQAAALGAAGTLAHGEAALGVHSEYFLVEHRLVLGRAELHTQALLRSRASGRINDGPDADDPLPTTVLWLRRR